MGVASTAQSRAPLVITGRVASLVPTTPAGAPAEGAPDHTATGASTWPCLGRRGQPTALALFVVISSVVVRVAGTAVMPFPLTATAQQFPAEGTLRDMQQQVFPHIFTYGIGIQDNPGWLVIDCGLLVCVRAVHKRSV